MNKVAITISALALTAVLAGACSSSNEPAKPTGFDEGAGGNGGRLDGGKDPADDAGEDADEDGDITDARDELIPNDGSRGEDSGDAGDEVDALPEPECLFDSDCTAKMALGTCEQALCVDQQCTKAPAKIGTLCDDGEACTEGDSCDGNGICVGGLLDTSNESCVVKLTPNSVWITEIMGAPVPIENSVAAEDGQWIELTARGSKAVSLERATLAYYEWDANEAEPTNPEPVLARLEGLVLPSQPQLLVRSSDPFVNGNLPPAVEYANISFGRTRNARLLLIAPEWRPALDGEFAVPAEHVIDSVFIPAETFGEGNEGRSWQASAPLPAGTEPDARVFCHTPAQAAHAYAEEGTLKNYGTPGVGNVACGP